MRPLISITIPTFNRSTLLRKNLQRLVTECQGIDQSLIEIIVSDNDSSDNTAEVVHEAIAMGLPIRYVRNEQNIGSDANFAQCFNLATGKYAMIMGDDDHFTNGAIPWLLQQLIDAKENYGVVFLKAYAYQYSGDLEQPHSEYRATAYTTEKFLLKISHQLTFISGLLMNKDLIKELDAKQFCGGNLVQVYLLLRAALKSSHCLYLSRYMLACVRSSSADFDYGKVFVLELGKILDEHLQFGLTKQLILQIENKMTYKLLTYLALRQRLADVGNPKLMYQNIASRYHGRFLFEYALGPILKSPRNFAVPYGMLMVLLGRLANGELSRAFWLIWSRFKLRQNSKSSP